MWFLSFPPSSSFSFSFDFVFLFLIFSLFSLWFPLSFHIFYFSRLSSFLVFLYFFLSFFLTFLFFFLILFHLSIVIFIRFFPFFQFLPIYFPIYSLFYTHSFFRFLSLSWNLSFIIFLHFFFLSAFSLYLPVFLSLSIHISLPQHHGLEDLGEAGSQDGNAGAPGAVGCSYAAGADHCCHTSASRQQPLSQQYRVTAKHADLSTPQLTPLSILSPLISTSSPLTLRTSTGSVCCDVYRHMDNTFF